MTPSTLTVIDPQTIDSNLRLQLDELEHNCTQCGTCVAECHFLTRYGDPQQFASSYDTDNAKILARPFECNLCGLCTQVCPDGLDPAQMFLEMRREAFSRGLTDLPEHRGLRKYERIGNSKACTWYALPDGCDTIFFPGCALVGSRSDVTRKVFEHLKKTISNIGIVLDCCNKPSHDLGDSDHFNKMFREMHSYLLERNIRKVLVACPNCLKVFKQYAPNLVTRTVYEILAENPSSELANVTATVTIHDPCASREDTATQVAVRQLLERAGAKVAEMPHSRRNTICCGEGGGAGCLVPKQTQQWINQRLEEAQGKPIVSYCAGCTNSFSNRTTTAHVLDLLFEPKTDLTSKHRVTKTPFTYIKRLKFKKSLQRNFPAVVASVRSSASSNTKQTKPVALITMTILSTLILGVAVILRLSPF